MPAPYAVFTKEEHLERVGRLRQFLRSSGFEAAVLVAPEHLYYFGGYDSWVGVNSPQALVLTAGDDEPTLLLRDVDLALALETSWLADIRTYSLVLEDFPSIVREILREKGCGDGRLASESQSYALPYGLGAALSEACQPAELVDATSDIGRLRILKSATELRLLESAGKYASLGLEAFRQSISAGRTEIEVAAQLEGAMRKAGSDYPAIPTELSSGSRTAGGHATPRTRVISDGDLVHAEFAGVAERYHAVAIQTVGCGSCSFKERELYDHARRSLDAGIAAAKPGVCVADVEEASLQPLKAAGLAEAAQMRFGYGIGAAYPPIWLEALQIARGFEDTLQPGMAFVLHSCLELPEEGLGVIQGGTYVLEDDGLRMLAGAGSVELLQA